MCPDIPFAEHQRSVKPDDDDGHTNKVFKAGRRIPVERCRPEVQRYQEDREQRRDGQQIVWSHIFGYPGIDVRRYESNGRHVPILTRPSMLSYPNHASIEVRLSAAATTKPSRAANIKFLIVAKKGMMSAGRTRKRRRRVGCCVSRRVDA